MDEEHEEENGRYNIKDIEAKHKKDARSPVGKAGERAGGWQLLVASVADLLEDQDGNGQASDPGSNRHTGSNTGTNAEESFSPDGGQIRSGSGSHGSGTDEGRDGAEFDEEREFAVFHVF